MTFLAANPKIFSKFFVVSKILYSNMFISLLLVVCVLFFSATAFKWSPTRSVMTTSSRKQITTLPTNSWTQMDRKKTDLMMTEVNPILHFILLTPSHSYYCLFASYSTHIIAQFLIISFPRISLDQKYHHIKVTGSLAEQGIFLAQRLGIIFVALSALFQLKKMAQTKQ